jgi:hypothetical protein
MSFVRHREHSVTDREAIYTRAEGLHRSGQVDKAFLQREQRRRWSRRISSATDSSRFTVCNLARRTASGDELGDELPRSSSAAWRVFIASSYCR